ncbi:MAG TPA: hypothetical protein PLQ41_04775 [bacterium]|nr:hypothetical protein [bacterium]HPP30325.1 hypothetical protein [bacterium]
MKELLVSRIKMRRIYYGVRGVRRKFSEPTIMDFHSDGQLS